MHPLPLPVRRLWRSAALAGGVTIGVAGVAIDLVSRRQLDLVVPPVILPVLLAALAGVAAWWLADLKYRAWRFELTDEWVQARWGVLTHHSATIPRNRIQTVTSQNGPIDRLLGLTSVTIHTAGAGAPNLAIPHLDDATVEWLRHELARGRQA